MPRGSQSALPSRPSAWYRNDDGPPGRRNALLAADRIEELEAALTKVARRLVAPEMIGGEETLHAVMSALYGKDVADEKAKGARTIAYASRPKKKGDGDPSPEPVA